MTARKLKPLSKAQQDVIESLAGIFVAEEVSNIAEANGIDGFGEHYARLCRPKARQYMQAFMAEVRSVRRELADHLEKDLHSGDSND